MKLPRRAQEAPESAGGIGCLPDARPEPSYTQQATWYPRHMNQRLALWLQKEKEQEQDTLCWESCPERELCWCRSSCSLGMLAPCPAWQLREFCKKSEGEFPLQPWLRTQARELCRQKRHYYPSTIPSHLLGSTSSRQRAGQLAFRPWMGKMYSTRNTTFEFFVMRANAEAFKNKYILILECFQWVDVCVQNSTHGPDKYVLTLCHSYFTSFSRYFT